MHFYGICCIHIWKRYLSTRYNFVTDASEVLLLENSRVSYARSRVLRQSISRPAASNKAGKQPANEPMSNSTCFQMAKSGQMYTHGSIWGRRVNLWYTAAESDGHDNLYLDHMLIYNLKEVPEVLHWSIVQCHWESCTSQQRSLGHSRISAVLSNSFFWESIVDHVSLCMNFYKWIGISLPLREGC